VWDWQAVLLSIPAATAHLLVTRPQSRGGSGGCRRQGIRVKGLATQRRHGHAAQVATLTGDAQQGRGFGAASQSEQSSRGRTLPVDCTKRAWVEGRRRLCKAARIQVERAGRLPLQQQSGVCAGQGRSMGQGVSLAPQEDAPQGKRVAWQQGEGVRTCRFWRLGGIELPRAPSKTGGIGIGRQQKAAPARYRSAGGRPQR
jgi:hypothetical protein